MAGDRLDLVQCTGNSANSINMERRYFKVCNIKKKQKKNITEQRY